MTRVVSTINLLKRPLVLASVLIALAMSIIVSASYLGGFLDPKGNMSDIPIALVNEDAGATIGGQSQNLGDVVLSRVMSSTPKAEDAVKWTVLTSRQQALDGLGQDEYFAAVVIPKDYSERVGALSGMKTQSEPARIEVLTNPAAGSFAGSEAEQIATAAVSRVSDDTSTQLVEVIGDTNMQVAPDTAGVVANPVQTDVTVAQPITDGGGRGLAPFYFALMLVLAGYIGTAIIDVGVDYATGRENFEVLGAKLRQAFLQVSHLGIWETKLVLTLTNSVLSGLLITGLAVGLLDMDTTQSAWTLALFAVLAVAAISAVTLFFVTAFGRIGLLLALLVTTIFGVPSAGGVYPLEMVPDFFRALGSVLPLRYITDGARALIFFGGEVEAGLGTALWVLVTYVAIGLGLGGATASLADRYDGHRKADKALKARAAGVSG